MESEKKLTPILEKSLQKKNLSQLDRAFITELVLGILRQREYLDWIIDHRIDQAPTGLSLRVRNLLRIGIYQILFLSKVPSSAAVNETVKLARSLGGKPMAGFVNAVLRGIARSPQIELPNLEDDPIRNLTVQYSHPAWIVKRWVSRYGLDRTIQICLANNRPAPLTVRVNRTKTSRERLTKTLEEEGVRSRPCLVSQDGLHLELEKTKGGVSGLKCYRRGEFYVQDEAAQLVGRMVDPKPDEHILDACAAPGGKTTHMAELMGDRGRIVALDHRSSRLHRLEENVNRLGLTIIEPVVADAKSLGTRFEKESFDRILVDAPCSGLGLLRRNPEAKWKKTEDLISYYQSIQIGILMHVEALLKPGGVLVYSTCTTEPEENEWVLDAFRKTHPAYRIEDIGQILPESATALMTDEGVLNTVNNSCQMDSFFAVRMIKNP